MDQKNKGNGSVKKSWKFKKPIPIKSSLKRFSNKQKKTYHKKSWSPHVWPHSAQRIGRMLPNLITIAALCMGLTAVHFAFLQQWEKAVASTLIAGVLDGIDGRLARYLGISTEFGAELDSLADFINFGVGPCLLVYFFSLHQLKGLGWIFCLFFSSCTGLRLARFNIHQKTPKDSQKPDLFSVGVPAPAGALIALIPMIASFVFSWTIPMAAFCLFLLISGLLMISRYPTFIFKKFTVSSDKMGLFLLASLAFIAGLVTFPWEMLLLVGVVYLGSLLFSGYYFRKINQKKHFF